MIYRILTDISKNLRKNRVGRELYSFLEAIGLRGGINRFKHWIDRRHMIPLGIILKNREFFENHKPEIRKCLSLLSDEESRDVFKSMIKYRCTGKYNDLPHNSFHTQYFINDFFLFGEGECYVDCGAYDGDTIISFKRLMKKKKIRNYKIVAFEPDHQNASILKKNMPEVYCIEKGVWSKETTLEFSEKGQSSSSFLYDQKHENTALIAVTSIDACVECIDASFIKMDIEGSEYEGLKGAENTIKRNKPKLAVCIYHSNEDMLRLIPLVKEILPEYRLYVRQHTNGWAETVLYACV